MGIQGYIEGPNASHYAGMTFDFLIHEYGYKEGESCDGVGNIFNPNGGKIIS